MLDRYLIRGPYRNQVDLFVPDEKFSVVRRKEDSLPLAESDANGTGSLGEDVGCVLFLYNHST